MSYVASGISGASPIWNKIMTNLVKNQPNQEFLPPDSLVTINICPSTGTLPCDGCPGKPEYFIKGTEPTKACLPETINEEKNITHELEQSLRAHHPTSQREELIR